MQIETTSQNIKPLQGLRYCPVCDAPLGKNPAQKTCSVYCRNKKNKTLKKLKALPTGVIQGFSESLNPSSLPPVDSFNYTELTALVARQAELLEKQNQLIERLLSQTNHLPPSQPIAPQTRQNPQNNTPTSDLDDIAIEVTKAKVDGNPTFNLILSAACLSGDFSYLALEVLEYGVKQGKIEPKHLEQRLANKPKENSQKSKDLPLNGNPKAIAGANITLSAPTFDDSLDLEIDWN